MGKATEMNGSEKSNALDEVMDAAFIAPACRYGQPLYRIDEYLVVGLSELEVASRVKARMCPTLGSRSTPEWFATVGYIAARLRPHISYRLN
jgi:hypothetical protein